MPASKAAKTARRAAERPTSEARLRVVELYAGTGRCTEPYRLDDRFEIALLADNSVAAREAYRANHEDVPYATLDLETASAADVQARANGAIDVLLGCPPCQGFSEGGLRAKDDPRNRHIVRFAQLIVALRPRAFALENVPMAATSKQFATFRRAVERAGYEMAAGVLNAAEYGSAQARQRLVAVGRLAGAGDGPVALPEPTHTTRGEYFDYSSGKLRRFAGRSDHLLGTTSSTHRAVAALRARSASRRRAVLELEMSPGPSTESAALTATPRVGEVIGGLPPLGSPEAEALAHVRFAHGPQMLEAMGRVAEGGQRTLDRRYHGAAYARLHGQGLARTLTRYFSNAGSGRFWHPTENRSLTVREAARLQGFEDGFTFLSGAQRANAGLVGNALDAALAQVSFASVRAALNVR